MAEKQAETQSKDNEHMSKNKKDKVIRFRVTESEYNEVKKLAEEEGKTISELFRSFLWGEIE